MLVRPRLMLAAACATSAGLLLFATCVELWMRTTPRPGSVATLASPPIAFSSQPPPEDTSVVPDSPAIPVNTAETKTPGNAAPDRASPPPATTVPPNAPDDLPVIRQLVSDYFKAEYKDRYAFVMDGERLKPIMATHYADRPALPAATTVVLDEFKLIKPGVGFAAISLQGVHRGQKLSVPAKAVLRFAGGKWRIDWPATAGHNQLPLKVFTATAPEKPVTLRVTAELSTYFNYQYRNLRETHWSFQLREPNSGEFIHGYAEKESAEGKRLFALLQDGKQHDITVSVYCTGQVGSVAEIAKVVSESWLAE